ncbi:Helix-turn-helix domain of resolvase [Chryseobacterium nakagawai]|uniref:Transposase n=1 Tax=Chryseobacterium nakagawai TaxID=1241982 RepID=A0AAD1DQ21_CHRNA|nr:helix-turn-helix domain-containing protein [Chryseobacterium nakagawai]AZA90261.1 transposase [Chryseobacterium nakagawai]VEH21736.1 Helix-turn-helix domain of resolvase [Chryseobacterium nakagawai]
MLYKQIHIGECIEEKVKQENIEMDRLMRFLDVSEEEILKMYKEPEITTYMLLKWSKVLEYDFFRIYSQHLILYAPPKCRDSEHKIKHSSLLPVFRKNIYTKEIIEFMIEMVNDGKKTRAQIIEEYKIPKTTLYKWLEKYNKQTLMPEQKDENFN